MVMVDLCGKCKKFEKCIEEDTMNDCIDNDYISFVPKKNGCEGCYYEDWNPNGVLSPCKNCVRNTKINKRDNYISKESERNKYND